MGGEAWYLVNATDGNLNRSGMAYYSNVDNAGNHQAPDLYVEIQADGNAIWEGIIQQADYGQDYLRTCVINNGDHVSVGTTVGVARNNGRAFNIYKGDKSAVWQKNGWTYHGIYVCE